MIEHGGIEHGGALDRAVARFGGTASGWLDLSTGINPEHFPLPDLPAEIWNRLPDEALLQETLALARDYYGVAADAPVVAAPGTQGLIQLVPRLLAPATVAVVGPTYQEHAASFAASGWRVAECRAIAEIPGDATVAVIVNPNNPDGRVAGRDELLALAARPGAKGGLLAVDEAFADADPRASVAGDAAHAPLIVLKSFGKFFGLAGIRLGFAFGRSGIVDEIARRLGPWAVPGPTLAIAAHAFRETDALHAFRIRIEARRHGLSEVLRRCGLREIGGTALFALVERTDAHCLHEELCEQHILVRKFAYAPHWLRIGLAPDDAGLARLETGLQKAGGQKANLRK